MRTSLLPLFLALLAPLARGADEYQLHEKTLENGLHIVTLEDRSCPVVAVQVWYHVGSKDEKPDRTGFAHMFEHMMFRGTDHLGPEEHFEYIRGAGGDCNAYTSFDQTVYVETVPKNQLAMVLWLEAERMSALKVDEEGFAVERSVVEEERRLGQNQPYGTVLEKVLPQVYKEHPYRWSVVGDIDHLRAATSEELLRFWETYYVPNNATLVVVGDVEHETVEAEAERAFGWIPRCADPQRVQAREPLPGEPLLIEIEEEKGPVPIIAAAYRTVPQDHPDALPLEMLMSILGAGESSRIYRSVVDENEKSAMAMAAAMGLEHDGFAAAAAVLMPFGDAQEALKLIEQEIERIRSEPVSEAELSKAKANFQRALVDESLTVESKARQIGTACLFHGGAGYLNKRAERIEAVTIDELRRVAETYLVPERRITLSIKPTLGGMVKSLFSGLTAKPKDEKGEAKSDKEKPATSTMAERQGPKAEAVRPEGYPEAVPAAPLLAARVPMDSVATILDNGLQVVVVENHEVPIVAMRLGLLNGAFLDPPEKPGCAALACQMLAKGTRDRSAQELAEELETFAVELSAGAEMDSASVRGSAVTGQLGRLARLLADVVKNPTFPDKEFQKLQKQVLTGLAISEKQPAAIAGREYQKALFDAHCYARDASGSSQDVKKLTAADCAAWWRSSARPDQAILYFAGDVTPEVAFELAEAFLGDWQVDGEAPRAEEVKAPEAAANRIVLVDLPGSIQSQIRVGHIGIDRHDPRYHVGRIVTQVFGGAFNSRLNKSIRVEKGLTYGAHGGLHAGRFAGQLDISTFTKTATTVAAVEAILVEIERMQSEAPTAKELDQARSYLAGSFAGEHETPASIAAELWSLKVCGLTTRFIDDYLDTVVKTTAEDVVKVAREVFDPEHLLIVVAGDAAELKEGLAKIAPVTVLDAEGLPQAKAEEAPQEE
ncbi:MAG: insulinase family protein [Planctomycetes bacterium]|nr:insulinase family protein [Planctomycetota bacterium]